MKTIQSADGTNLAFDMTGNGPALVIVAGAFCDRHSKKDLTAYLSGSYTVYEYDRRGRGHSGPADDATVEREIEDLATIAALTGEAPFVFGDSSGGALVIAAAAAGTPFRSIAIYEVPFTPGPSIELANQLTQLVADGDRAQAVERFLTLMGTPAHAIDGMKQSPHWAHLESMADTLPLDIKLCNDGRVPDEQLTKIHTPLLAIAGDQNPWAIKVATSLAASAPNAWTHIVEGQGHAVPDQILSQILTTHFR